MKKLITIVALSGCFLLTPFFAADIRSDDDQEIEFPRCSADLYQNADAPTRCIWSEKDIRLYVIPAPKGRAVAPPLLYLLGGPGGRGDVHVPHMELLAGRMGRTVLLPDPADSFPSLECRRADLDDAHWGIARAAQDAVFYTRPLQQNRLAACLEQVDLGGDVLASIATQAQADYLEELRQVLAIPKWVVMAESYGARVALSLAKNAPAAITRLVLDSPETPWVDEFWHTGRNFHEALARLSEFCRDEYLCPAMRLHLEKRLPELISVFNRDLVEPLALRDLYSRKVVAYARPTQEQLLITAFMALRSPQRVALMPYIAASGNDETLKKRFGLLLSQLLKPGGSLNVGYHHAVRCSELPLRRWYGALAEDLRDYPEIAPFTGYLDWRQRFVCNTLGLVSPEGFAAPAMPNVPTLILSGGLDPVTPYGVVAQAFTNSGVTHQHYPTLGHIVHSQADCVLADVVQFMNAEVSSSQTTCRKKDLELRFYTPVMRR
ncbi:hypothetical protein [Kordiimonas sp.]|uniref:alpha/beta hydrolase n=1 Tax=Kordiimonas sp. TaxID=1970157 RepID=UPI003A9492D3